MYSNNITLKYFLNRYFKIMESEIVFKDGQTCIIGWSNPEVGFGQLTIKYDNKLRDYVIDSECMGIEHIIEVIKNIK